MELKIENLLLDDTKRLDKQTITKLKSWIQKKPEIIDWATWRNWRSSSNSFIPSNSLNYRGFWGFSFLTIFSIAWATKYREKKRTKERISETASNLFSLNNNKQMSQRVPNTPSTEHNAIYISRQRAYSNSHKYSFSRILVFVQIVFLVAARHYRPLWHISNDGWISRPFPEWEWKKRAAIWWIHFFFFVFSESISVTMNEP